MLRRLSSLAIIAPLALTAAAFAADPHAAGDGHGHEPLSAIPSIPQGVVTGVTAIVVFIIVLAVLCAKVWPAIARGLDERADKIKNEIAAAELAQKQAQAALAEYERNLAQARAEAQKMLDDAKAQQQQIAAELKAKSDIELNALREKAKRDIDQAKAAAVIELNAYSANLATDMARKILKREVSDGDQQRLISESLAELQTAGRA